MWKALTRRPGLLFLVAAAVLAGLAIANITLVGGNSRTGYDYGDLHVGDERAVLARSVVMHPGDRLLVRPELTAFISSAFDTYDFYVVKGGDRFELLDGSQTEPVYVHLPDLSAGHCCPRGYVVFDRPDDAAWQRQGAAPIETGPGTNVTERELLQAVLDQPERIDLVWVFNYRPGYEAPQTPEEQRNFANLLEGQLRGFSRGDSPTVFHARVLQWQPVMYAGMSAAALAAAVATIAWVARLRKTPEAGTQQPSADTESLLRLYDSAGVYLTSLRDLLVASVVVVGLVSLHLFIDSAVAPLLVNVERAAIALGWSRVLEATVVLLYLAVIVAWFVTLFHVQRALQRWRRRAGRPPVDVNAD